MLTRLDYPSPTVLSSDPCSHWQVLKFQCLVCFLRSYIKMVVKFLNTQPHSADSFWATYRSTLKFFAILEETNLYASYLLLP
jgi:hypothetical protein